MTGIRWACILAAASFVLSVLSIRADAAVIETFDYPNGNLDHNGSATDGWSGPWSGGSFWNVDNARAMVTPPTTSGYHDSPNRREALPITTSSVYIAWTLQAGDMGGPISGVPPGGVGAGVRLAFADTAAD